MSKVKFGENDSRIVELQQTASLERQQADDAIRKHTRMQRRIHAFYDAIEYVSFSSTEEAPIWASNWVDWLLDGIVPVPDSETAPEPEEMQAGMVEETAPTDQIAVEAEIGLTTEETIVGDDDPEPDPPVAATA